MRILALALAGGLLLADATISLKEGWQLVGAPTKLQSMELLDNEHVVIVWSYDSASQQWRGFSPDANLTQRMADQGIATLQTLEPWQAVWVESAEAWDLEIVMDGMPSAKQNDVISLKTGWNLVALPQDVIVPDDFFGDALVWKYTTDGQWQASDAALDFPSIDAIAVSEGVWVKSATDREIDVGETLSKLRTFTTEAEMLDYIRTMMQLSGYDYYPVVFDEVSDDAQDPAVDDATDTNVQEAGVDEGDILKHDGTYIYSIDNRNMQIVITSFAELVNQSYSPLATIDLTDRQILTMYLHDDRLAVVTGNNYYYDYYAASRDVYSPYYDESTFRLHIYDVSDIHAITPVATYEIDGNYEESRMIDGELFLISQFYPTVQYEYPPQYVETICTTLDQDDIWATCSMTCIPGQECVEECQTGEDYEAWFDNDCNRYNYDETGAWFYDYDNPVIVSEDLIPEIVKDEGTATALVTPEAFYAPIKLDQRANLTSISRFAVADGSRRQTLSFLGNTHTYYASPEALYLVSSEYPLYFDYMHYQEQQMIYKFGLGDPMRYIGRGFVPGRMLSQFSMGEKGDYLRVATTSGWAWWGEGGTSNAVYTMKVADETLAVVGTLDGLGHENETIRAVRFTGDRGYVVTFEQTDPLYTLDLSDPANPKSVGELEIPGFSTYLHVVDENRVLSIGRNADAEGNPQELQFQLFDVSDFSAPKLADRLRIGDGYTYSEAEYNHRAFTYRASDTTFGVPYRTYDNQTGIEDEHFGVYRLNGLGITALQTLSAPSSDWGNAGRGLIFDVEQQTYAALLKGANMMCESIETEGE